MRKAAARILEAVCAAIGQLLEAFSSQECTNYFQNAGYAPTKYHPALAGGGLFRVSGMKINLNQRGAG